MKKLGVTFKVEPIDNEPGVYGVVREEQIPAHRCNFGVDGDGLISVVGVNGKLVVDSVDDYQYVWGAYAVAQLRESGEAQADAVLGDKYRTEAEGDLLRIYALREIPHRARRGERGGLIESLRNLDQNGYCWIDGTSRVLGGGRVCGNAYVYGDSIINNAQVKGDAWVSGSTVDGNWNISDHARVASCNLNGGDGMIWHRANLEGTTISLSDRDDRVTIGGDSELRDCLITGSVSLMGVVLEDASLRGNRDLLSVWTRFGALSAYRGSLLSGRSEDGVQRFAVGCQRARNFGDIRIVARRHDSSRQELDLLEGFLGMVKVARAGWDLTVAPVGDDDNKNDE